MFNIIVGVLGAMLAIQGANGQDLLHGIIPVAAGCWMVRAAYRRAMGR